MTHHPTTYDLMSYCLFLLPVPFSCIYRGPRASFNKQSSHSGSAHGLPIDTTSYLDHVQARIRSKKHLISHRLRQMLRQVLQRVSIKTPKQGPGNIPSLAMWNRVGRSPSEHLYIVTLPCLSSVFVKDTVISCSALYGLLERTTSPLFKSQRSCPWAIASPPAPLTRSC